MEVRDGSGGEDTGSVGSSALGMGQDGASVQEDSQSKVRAIGTEDRTSQTPKRKENLQNPRRPGRGSIGRYQGITPKIKVGYKCIYCPHVHIDHGMYDKHLCLIEGCDCVGLKIESKDIPSRID